MIPIVVQMKGLQVQTLVWSFPKPALNVLPGTKYFNKDIQEVFVTKCEIVQGHFTSMVILRVGSKLKVTPNLFHRAPIDEVSKYAKIRAAKLLDVANWVEPQVDVVMWNVGSWL